MYHKHLVSINHVQKVLYHQANTPSPTCHTNPIATSAQTSAPIHQAAQTNKSLLVSIQQMAMTKLLWLLVQKCASCRHVPRRGTCPNSRDDAGSTPRISPSDMRTSFADGQEMCPDSCEEYNDGRAHQMTTLEVVRLYERCGPFATQLSHHRSLPAHDYPDDWVIGFRDHRARQPGDTHTATVCCGSAARASLSAGQL